MGITKAKADFTRDRLATLKRFPPIAESVARAEISQMIAGLCRTDAEADGLAEQMRNDYDEWPGPKTLREVFMEKYRKDALRDSSAGKLFMGWQRPARVCDICEDNGVICENATYRRCQCDCGQKVEAKYLGYLNGQTVSAKNARGESSALKPITAADFATLGVKTSPAASVSHGGPSGERSEREKVAV